MDHSLAMAKGLALFNETMTHAMQGHSRWMGHSEEFWQNVIHWWMKWQTVPVFLPWESHEHYEKGKKEIEDGTRNWAPQGWKVSIMLLGKSRGQLLIAPERMKRLHQIGKDAQLWMCLVVVVKVLCTTVFHRNLDIISREVWHGQADDGEFEHWHLQNHWTKMYGNGCDHYIYYCGQESRRRNGVTLIVNKRVQNAVLGFDLKNDRMILVHFQGKPFNITAIQVYAPTTDAKEAEVGWFCDDLQDLLELTPSRKHVLFI